MLCWYDVKESHDWSKLSSARRVNVRCLSVCRLRNKKHMDNIQPPRASPGHLTLTGRESGASIQSFLNESFDKMAASLGDIVRSPTTTDLCLDMAHTEISLIIRVSGAGDDCWVPGVGPEIVPTELLFPSVGAVEWTGLGDSTLPDMAELDVLTMQAGGLEEPADILVVLVI